MVSVLERLAGFLGRFFRVLKCPHPSQINNLVLGYQSFTNGALAYNAQFISLSLTPFSFLYSASVLHLSPFSLVICKSAPEIMTHSRYLWLRWRNIFFLNHTPRPQFLSFTEPLIDLLWFVNLSFIHFLPPLLVHKPHSRSHCVLHLSTGLAHRGVLYMWAEWLNELTKTGCYAKTSDCGENGPRPEFLRKES